MPHPPAVVLTSLPLTLSLSPYLTSLCPLSSTTLCAVNTCVNATYLTIKKGYTEIPMKDLLSRLLSSQHHSQTQSLS